MLQFVFRSGVLMLALGGLTIALDASSAIGVATAKGGFRIDRAEVWSNATVFDGTLIETTEAGSLLRLDGGVRVRLGSSSRGQVFRQRLLLEKGEGLIENTGSYRVAARGLQIVPVSSSASARVAIADNQRVRVTALLGNLHVTTGDGVLLAELNPGRSLEFDSQVAGAAPPFSVSGRLSKTEGRYFLKDDTTGVTFELKGEELEGYVGQRVEVTGTDAGASGTIRVTRITRLSGGSSSAPRAAARSGTTKAVIAGVAIAAVGAGTTLALIGEEEQKPAISR